MLTKDYSQLWLKKGKIHDDAREEMIVKVENQYKNDLLKIIYILEFQVDIKWFRVRNSFNWNNIKVTIDYTHGYGYIMELELLVSSEDEIEQGKNRLNQLFKEFDLEVVDKVVFKEKYEDYKINWTKYTKDINEDEFLK